MAILVQILLTGGRRWSEETKGRVDSGFLPYLRVRGRFRRSLERSGLHLREEGESYGFFLEVPSEPFQVVVRGHRARVVQVGVDVHLQSDLGRLLRSAIVRRA